jgi:hypothetical protein
MQSLARRVTKEGGRVARRQQSYAGLTRVSIFFGKKRFSKMGITGSSPVNIIGMICRLFSWDGDKFPRNPGGSQQFPSLDSLQDIKLTASGDRIWSQP